MMGLPGRDRSGAIWPLIAFLLCIPAFCIALFVVYKESLHDIVKIHCITQRTSYVSNNLFRPRLVRICCEKEPIETVHIIPILAEHNSSGKTDWGEN